MPPEELPVVPRWLEKYSRLPSGEKAGPVISEEDWPVTRRNGATMSSGVMTQISRLPPSSATNRSPELVPVMLSTPVSGAVPETSESS